MKNLLISIALLAMFACAKKSDNPLPLAPPVSNSDTEICKDSTYSFVVDTTVNLTIYESCDLVIIKHNKINVSDTVHLPNYNPKRGYDMRKYKNHPTFSQDYDDFKNSIDPKKTWWYLVGSSTGSIEVNVENAKSRFRFVSTLNKVK